VLNAKIKIAIVSVLLIGVLLVSAFSVAKLLSNVNPDAYAAQAQKIFNQAKTEFEQIRNVTLPSNLALHVMTKQEAIDRWGRTTADADVTNILRQEKVYKGLFMMAENDSLYQATVDWAGNWGAATLKPDIYVIKENFDPFNMPDAEATFVHELTHVWQPSLPYTTTFDRDKAQTALVEGDASFMGDYFKNHTQTSPNPMATADGVPVFLINSPILNALHPIPDTVWKLNFFPYDYGKTFVSAAYQNGGWATVNQAYQQGYPPTTTEQILSPDKYFANETAQPVQPPTLAENNWTIASNSYGQNSNSYGEYFIQVMLGNHLLTSEAQQAAAGWAGDNFTYYERGGDYLFTWNIKWDSSCDASEFYVAFHNMANAAGATDYGSCNWFANGRYLSITWNQDQNSTLIAGSNIQAPTQAVYFTQT
jgi:hypothetical protein